MFKQIFLFSILLLIITYCRSSQLFCQNYIEPDSIASYKGKIILKNSLIIESDYIKLLKNCVIYRYNTNSLYDTIKTNSVDFFRFNTGHYTLEYAGIGALGGALILLYVHNRLLIESKDRISNLECVGFIGGTALIGMIIGMISHKYETFYISEKIKVTTYNTNSSSENYFHYSNLLTISIEF